jgi:uncharacterized iron-regulated membrane protein
MVLRKFVFLMHLYLGLIAGLFLVLLGITGSLMAFEPEIDHLLHYHLSFVSPGEKKLSLSEISQKVQSEFPSDAIKAYTLSSAPDLSYQIYLGEKEVYVDPYTGKILGFLNQPDYWEDLQNTIHQLHLRLAFRNASDTGKKIMSWAGLALLLMELTGLVLWWKQKRFSIKWKNPSRRVWFDLHNSIGIFSIIFMFILTITGLVIGFERQTTPMLYSITGSKPSSAPNFNVTAPPNARQIGIDSVIEIARNAIPGAAPYTINVPNRGEVYAIRSRFPEDRTPGGRSKIFIDPYSGKLLFAESSRTAPVGTRLIIANRAIHTGDLFGLPSKIMMSLASLSVVFQFISGVTMWWKRKKFSKFLNR